jgi:hypothetical protein
MEMPFLSRHAYKWRRRSRSVSRWIVSRKDVSRPFGSLPIWYRRLTARLGHKTGALHQPVLVDVAWAVRKYLTRSHPNDELGLGIVLHQLITLVYARYSVDPRSMRSITYRLSLLFLGLRGYLDEHSIRRGGREPTLQGLMWAIIPLIIARAGAIHRVLALCS